jgi:hypothetical protein
LSPVRPPGVEKTSRLGSRDPIASGVKCPEPRSSPDFVGAKS